MNTQKPNIKVGDILSLRNGRKVKILETDAPGDQPIVVLETELRGGDTAARTHMLAADGRYWTSKNECGFDLILPKRRVPWNKLTDVELGHEYLVDGDVDRIDGLWLDCDSNKLHLSFSNVPAWFSVPSVKHRAPRTTEWLECDKEEE